MTASAISAVSRGRLDYLQWLGVDASGSTRDVPSPNKDWGYDVAGYTDVQPVFGGMPAFDESSRRPQSEASR